MERIMVTSSNIHSVGYDGENQILEVEFKNGGVYQYFGVQSSEYDEMLSAESKGKYLNANVKNRYPFSKL
ncbi:KTSC domain-containing protein [Massilia arenae]|uniref:KTSC domain-containing protein n=1 Tax=Massilia arenae TaxID=2603288 RepID=A0A5C7FS83_9BURK|nr:KTSC domain-containing protein [Massilia arenae]TXF98942.1 KTSC domain-containing protein [Massilia arenae]